MDQTHGPVRGRWRSSDERTRGSFAYARALQSWDRRRRLPAPLRASCSSISDRRRCPVKQCLNRFVVERYACALSSRPGCGSTLRTMYAFLAEAPDSTCGQGHQLLMWGVVADALPPLHDTSSDIVHPLIRYRPDDVCVAKLAAQ